PRAPPSMYATTIEQSGRLGGAAGGGRHVIKDSRAAVALIQAVVATDFVEHLWTKAHMAERAEAVAGFSHGNTAATVRHSLEEHQRLPRELCRDRRPTH